MLTQAAVLLFAIQVSGVEDDPKIVRSHNGANAQSVGSAASVDDPKLLREGTIRKSGPWPYRPRFKLGYRFLWMRGLEANRNYFNALAIDYFPVSGVFRLAIDTEIGFGSLESAWFFTSGVAVGIQRRGRVTPFIDGRFGAGLFGASIDGISGVSWMVSGGIDGGIEIYLKNRVLLSIAVGWVHPSYSGIDVAYTRANPLLAPKRLSFTDDAFTLKVGLGL